MDFGAPYPLYRSVLPVVVLDIYGIFPANVPSVASIGISPLVLNGSNLPYAAAACLLGNYSMPILWITASTVQCLRAGLNLAVASGANLSLVFPSLWNVSSGIPVFSVGVYDLLLVAVAEANATALVPWRDPAPLYFVLSGYPYAWDAVLAQFVVNVGNALVATAVPFSPHLPNAEYTAATSELLVGLVTPQVAPNGADFQPVYSLSVMPSAAIAVVRPMFMDFSSPFNLSLTTGYIYESGLSCILASQTPSFSVVEDVPATCTSADAVYGCLSFSCAVPASNFTGAFSMGLSLPGFWLFPVSTAGHWCPQRVAGDYLRNLLLQRSRRPVLLFCALEHLCGTKWVDCRDFAAASSGPVCPCPCPVLQHC